MLDPVDHRVEQRLRLWTASATAVPDAGRHEQAGELLSLRVAAAERLRDTVVIVDAALRYDELIGEAVPHHELGAVITKRREVRIIGRHDRSHLRHGVPEELQSVSVGQRVEVPGGIEIDPVLRLRDGDREWRRAAECVQSGASRLAIPKPLVAVVAQVARNDIGNGTSAGRRRRAAHGPLPHLVDRRCFGGSEASQIARRASGARDRRIRRRAVVALPRIGENAILHLQRVAARLDRLARGQVLLRGQRRGNTAADESSVVHILDHLIPDLPSLEAIPVDRRRAGQDSVVVERIVLRHAQALAAAGRAAVPVGVHHRPTVVALCELLPEVGHQMLGAVGEVDLQRNVRLPGVARAVAHAVIHAAESAAPARVTCIGHRAGVPVIHCGSGGRHRSRVAAATQRLPTTIPVVRQADPNIDRRWH